MSGVLFEAPRKSLLLETLRIPYGIVPTTPPAFVSRRDGDAPRPVVQWPPVFAEGPAFHRVDDASIYCRVSGEAPARDAHRGTWTPTLDVLDNAGNPKASVWRADDGSVHVPFEPDEVVANLLAERYVASRSSGAGSLLGVARRAYYRARPLIPRSVQLAMRRRFRTVQERATFPAWPAEPSLHRFYLLMLRLLGQVRGEPVPYIGAWPAGKAWALVLTHDVERIGGYRFVDTVAALERRVDVRSAWFFVPERDYRVEEEMLERLRGDGFEIGLHGLRHDGRDLEPATFERRLPEMRRYADQWGATGFRSPATHRDWELLPRLGVDYDSSYSDVARYEPQPGGSCSLWPFFIDDLVELPITMPMDHTVFEILGEVDERLWVEKAEWLRDRGGMALLLTHPDYLTVPGRLEAYERFLKWAADDPTCWHALPSEVSAWWRRRAVTVPVRSDRGWAARGPGADNAAVRLFAA
jgi:peptidoglycan/xylan/chitin deacetylase (PgdA/CDA1 family)